MEKCYQLDPDGYLVGETLAPGGYLPSGAVLSKTEPVLTKGKHPWWDGKKFIQKESHVGETGYLDGKPYIIRKHGERPKGFTTVPPYPEDADIDADARAYVLHNLAMIDAKYLTQRTLAGLAIGDEYALEQYQKHEEEAAPWRDRLATIPEIAEIV